MQSMNDSHYQQAAYRQMLMEQAEKERLLKEAKQSPYNTPRPLLAVVGERMVKLGQRLQEAGQQEVEAPPRLRTQS